jgi:regulator of ribonuclease activity A
MIAKLCAKKRIYGVRMCGRLCKQETFMAFFTADICDEYSDKTFVLGAGYKNYGGADRCEGQIVTIKLDKNNSDLIKRLRDEDGTGKVVVVDVDKAYFAVVGENLMKFAHQNNYAGIIVNGYIRDTFQIKDIPVALYALGTCSRKYIPVTQGESNEQLSFGGVDFNNGDYLYADTDGVIVTADKIV